VVDPLDWSAIHDYKKGGSYLTLTSCHPEGSAAYRIVVRAELVESSEIVASTAGAWL
jgi:sortase (surface protein transpeptidase)